MSLRAIGRELDIPRDTIRYWCQVTRTPDSHHLDKVPCPRCADPPQLPPEATQYAYLLGQYLGDGHLVLTARVPVLRIACADAYPGIMDEVEKAMTLVLGRSVSRNHSIGCTYMTAVAKHWPCLFPQAGPGKKHERLIDLEPWQREILTLHPGPFLRGLFHSDGCRATNTVRVRGQLYTYPRYFFSNESLNILMLCGEALDLLGIAWRLNRRNSLSVAQHDAVTALDVHVGPKQ